MHKFYKDLKELILNQDESTKKTLIPYYETLFQLSSYQEMKELLDTYQGKGYMIDFNDADDNDCYSNGWLEIYSHDDSISFTIELDIGEMKGHYCQCNPNDEGYNSNKGCCGILCDAHLPKVSIIKEVKVINYEFQGYECDLWELEEKWLTDYEKDLLHKKKLDKVSNLEAQIEILQRELNAVKSDLKN
ncbi:hypothetical protein MHB40_14490 [Lysinibacillus sp. FSL K6-0057]|uniref:hypothetical protein n=1 Tax=Lysinibacillus sp. FSL K6-0057 TaxID=2921411 RepID=UPI003159BC6A